MGGLSREDVQVKSGPGGEALNWVRRMLGWATEIRCVGRLKGATSSSLYGIEASGGSRHEKAVLRLIDNKKWLEEHPDIARQEAQGLVRASASGVPVPKFLGLDERGDWCGVPAVLMSMLEGRALLGPPHPRRFLEPLAEALVNIHAVEPGDCDWKYDPWYEINDARPPAWTKRPVEWQRAIDLVAAGPPAGESCFLHRDYHPMNVLWESGSISGVVDWPNACIGPRGVDLAHCRVNLASLYDVAVADRFLSTYESRLGFKHDRYWDLSAVIGLSKGPQLYPPWVECGADLTEQEVCDRRDDFLRGALKSASG